MEVTVLFNGAKVSGPVELRAMLTRRPETFVGVVTERMMTYALGRGLEYADMPSVRRVVSASAKQNFTFSTLVLSVVNSPAFLMKEKKSAPAGSAVAQRGVTEGAAR